MSKPWWTEEELQLLAYQWVEGSAALIEQHPEVWQAWVTHAISTIDPAMTTDIKMGRALREFCKSKGVEL